MLQAQGLHTRYTLKEPYMPYASIDQPLKVPARVTKDAALQSLLFCALLL